MERFHQICSKYYFFIMWTSQSHKNVSKRQVEFYFIARPIYSWEFGMRILIIGILFKGPTAPEIFRIHQLYNLSDA